MELRHLRYFLTIAEELSFRKAAARLHIAQPALSVQIRQLETEIGAALFSREGGRGIKLTDAGSVFLDHARTTLIQVGRGVTEARLAAKGETARVAIGFVPAAEYRVFPKLVPALHQTRPHVHLAFRDLKTLEQLDAIRRDELDLGFGWLPIPAKDFDWHPIADDSFIVALPAGHRLVAKAVVSIKDLSNEPLIFFPPHLYPDTHRRIERLFLSAGAVMNVIYELETSPSMINFVAMGGGCSLMPGYASAIRHEGVVYRPLKPPNVVISLAMIKKKGRGGLVESIFKYAAGVFSPD
jgi:DNA-binding transcriptional LysR family regulator